MTANTSEGSEIEIRGIGRMIHSNGRTADAHEYLAMADGFNGRRYIVMVDRESIVPVGIIDGSSGDVVLLEPLETIIFDGFPAYDPDAVSPRGWLQSFV